MWVGISSPHNFCFFYQQKDGNPGERGTFKTPKICLTKSQANDTAAAKTLVHFSSDFTLH